MISYTSTCDEIQRDFEKLKIPTDSPGFYNHPNFLAIEKENPDFLNNYARFVQCREYSEGYLRDSETKIRIAVEHLYAEIKADGRLGACIDASGILAQILEKENIWCYQPKGSLTINFPIDSQIPNRYFFSIDLRHEDIRAAHAWVVAPPFNVIDLTIKLQEYQPSRCKDYLPDYVLEKEFQPTEVYTTELCSPEAIVGFTGMGYSQAKLHFQVSPHLKEFFEIFPANKIKFEKTRLKYIPTAITAMDGTIETNKTFEPNGKSAVEIYEKIIKPKMS